MIDSSPTSRRPSPRAFFYASHDVTPLDGACKNGDPVSASRAPRVCPSARWLVWAHRFFARRFVAGPWSLRIHFGAWRALRFREILAGAGVEVSPEVGFRWSFLNLLGWSGVARVVHSFYVGRDLSKLAFAFPSFS